MHRESTEKKQLPNNTSEEETLAYTNTFKAPSQASAQNKQAGHFLGTKQRVLRSYNSKEAPSQKGVLMQKHKDTQEQQSGKSS